MENFEAVMKAAKELVELESQYQFTGTKAASLRLRKKLTDIKKLVVPARADLLKEGRG